MADFGTSDVTGSAFLCAVMGLVTDCGSSDCGRHETTPPPGFEILLNLKYEDIVVISVCPQKIHKISSLRMNKFNISAYQTANMNGKSERH